MTDWRKNFAEQEGETFVFRHYGLAPSVVFRNSNLSIGAKAVYGYLTTFVNGEQMKKGLFIAWPSRQRILNELNISVNTLGKYLRELRDAKLIKVEQGRRTLQEGRQVYGNNRYIIQPYIATSVEEKSKTIPVYPSLEKDSKSRSDHLKSCEPQETNTSITKGFSNTNNNSSIFSTKNEDQPGTNNTPVLEESPSSGENKQQGVQALIESWNNQGVNQHFRLGDNTRLRIQKALNEALEDYSWEELEQTIVTYSKLFKEGRCDHKYRLVEFMEKRGYEHFLHEGNWRKRSYQGPLTRDEFTYTKPKQDLSFFSFLDDEWTDAVS